MPLLLLRRKSEDSSSESNFGLRDVFFFNGRVLGIGGVSGTYKYFRRMSRLTDHVLP